MKLTKKVLVTLALTALFIVGSANIALAANQLPNAEVYLGSYSLTNLWSSQTWYSQPFKATQSTLNMRVDNKNTGEVNVTPQKKVNGVWENQRLAMHVGKGKSVTVPVIVTKGAEYRLRVTAPILSSSSGQIWCY